ncbi:DUF429 domain-containing protein [Sinomonas flava]|uniref:DUF429 domain-containing protein n=1 Tax=Sinomonas flava TaxID=496857 RepID=UPI0039A57F54
MRTLGIDLAADPKKTAAAVIEWAPETARIEELRLGVSDEMIVGLFGDCDVTGIDCPVGWPLPFLDFMSGHLSGDLAKVLEYDGLKGRRLLAYRETDRFVTRRTGLIPLSVSADRLAHPAMRCAVIQAKIAQRFGPEPRDGTGRLAEVYPAASLRLWGIHARRYKGTNATESAARAEVISQLSAAAPWLGTNGHEDAMAHSDDAFDAVVASLSARAVAIGATLRPNEEQADLARSEGWIHIPSGPVSDLLQ